MRIGELAERTAVNVQTVRYYERRGLLPEPARTRSGYREYGEDALLRLRFVLDAKGLGFTLSEIRELLDLRVDRGTIVEDVRGRALAKIEATKSKIGDLRRIQATLEQVIAACDGDASPDECALMRDIGADQVLEERISP